ncbi:FtsL-like putative cell division protein [Dysgonomonas sp. 520]|uniref:FtsL-like putative cell division protein n=1 Tax=Dysgonomonas sp. 520 TaxID=2302931 RepID=UPI002105F313|nr:FtsL-like putative cell division protein [Dysgonomonas sp. 520]
MHVISGTFLTDDLFLKNLPFIGVVVLLLFLHISHRYVCIEKVSKIEKLQKELKSAKYEALVISSDLTNISRQTQVQQLVDGYKLDLKQLKEPVYKIEE